MSPQRQCPRALTMKLQVAFAEWRGKASSCRLVWKQHFTHWEGVSMTCTNYRCVPHCVPHYFEQSKESRVWDCLVARVWDCLVAAVHRELWHFCTISGYNPSTGTARNTIYTLFNHFCQIIVMITLDFAENCVSKSYIIKKKKKPFSKWVPLSHIFGSNFKCEYPMSFKKILRHQTQGQC